MSSIQKEDIQHLANLARISLTEREIETLSLECSSILEYVAQLEEIAVDVPKEKTVGVHYNVLREDGDPHEPGIYSEKLLAAAPKREKDHISVKKILKDGQ